MTLKNADLIERFLNGGESGSSSRMEIKVLDGVRCIVGYGWAVYAADVPGMGVALFGDGYATDGNAVGWAGYSGTTTGHLQKIKGALESRDRPFAVADVQLRASSGFRRDERPTLTDMDRPLRQFVRENEVDPRGGVGLGHSPA